MFKRKYRRVKTKTQTKQKIQSLTPEEELEQEERQVKSKVLISLIVVLSIILLFALLFLAGWFLFEVEDVQVEGNELYSDEVICGQLLDDEYSWNSLYVFLKYKFEEPQEIPFIDKMQVQLTGRNSLNIRVYEKELVGYTYVAATGQYAYIDKDGIVVERSTSIIPGVAHIEGLNVTNVNLYEKLQVGDASLFKELLNLTQALEKYHLMPENITVMELGNFQLSYGEILVNFGQAEHVNDKVVRLQKIMPSIKNMHGILHMENWKNENSDITFEQTETEEKNE